MSDAVEIYVCLEGQALKEGKVEYSQSIYDKYGAEQDAKDRVKRNPLIAKVAYYRVNDEGDFRIFYSFTNKELRTGQTIIQKHDRKPKRKKARKRTFWEKLFGIGGGKKTKLKKKPPTNKAPKKQMVKKS